MFYVYCYLDPRFPGKFIYGDFEFGYKPFYIGKGKGMRCTRALEPNEFKKQKRTIKRNYLESLYKDGFKPIIIKLKENLTEDEAFNAEIFLIKLIGRMKYENGPLTNLSEGGDGGSGFKLSDGAKAKISSIHKDKKLTEEHKKKLSDRLKGIEPWNKGKSLTEEHRIKLLNRKLADNYSEVRSANYLIISPEGIEYKSTGIKSFCEEHNLKLKEMRRITRSGKTYKGWRCIKLTDKYKRG